MVSGGLKRFYDNFVAVPSKTHSLLESKHRFVGREGIRTESLVRREAP
jgi:hypothetical protein